MPCTRASSCFDQDWAARCVIFAVFVRSVTEPRLHLNSSSAPSLPVRAELCLVRGYPAQSLGILQSLESNQMHEQIQHEAPLGPGTGSNASQRFRSETRPGVLFVLEGFNDI